MQVILEERKDSYTVEIVQELKSNTLDILILMILEFKLSTLNGSRTTNGFHFKIYQTILIGIRKFIRHSIIER